VYRNSNYEIYASLISIRLQNFDILCQFCLLEEMGTQENDVYAFNPTKHGLQDSFRLTDYADLKG